MGRCIVASLLGAAVVFVWGSISWMMLPWHKAGMKHLPGGDATMAMIQEKLPESGLYVFPPYPEDQSDEAAMAEWGKKYTGAAYISMLVYRDSGYMEDMTVMFIRGYVLEVLGAGLIVCLLCLAGPSLRRYGQRVVFVALIGLFATMAGPLMDWNWLGFPLEFTIPIAADGIIAWSLAGMVIAALIKPKQAT